MVYENRLDDDRVSYTVAFTDLSADSAWSDSFFESFETAEFADAYVQEWVDKNACKEIVPEPTVEIDSATSTTETDIIHEYTLRRCVRVWKTGYIDVNYEVVYEWGEMEEVPSAPAIMDTMCLNVTTLLVPVSSLEVSMSRSKAEFKGNRERAGLSHKNIADALNVNIRTVRGWEDPKLDRYNAPAAAWEYIDHALEV